MDVQITLFVNGRGVKERLGTNYVSVMAHCLYCAEQKVKSIFGNVYVRTPVHENELEGQQVKDIG